ncbi:MAG: DNA-directed RNA polymerase subunit beta [Solibacillus sp.]
MTNELERRTQQPDATPRKRRRRGTEEPQSDQPIRWVQLRLIPIWLRIIIVTALFVGVAVLGLTIGYSFIGDGEVGGALKWSTWQHLLDIMQGKEN